MKVVIVSDIFGHTKHLEKLALNFGENTLIVNPYSNNNLSFDSEEEAYNYFLSSGGVLAYSDKLKNSFNSYLEDSCLIGFSAGGSAIYNFIKKVFCFYSSQIRHNIELTPIYKTSLFFPKFENKFSVLDLFDKLNSKENVTCIKTDYLHGFMNPLSKNFDVSAYDTYINTLKKEF